MHRTALLCAFATSMSLSSLALADIAPDPCEGKNEGDVCITVRDKPGTCVAVDCGSGGSGGRVDCGNGLECVEGSTTGSGGAGGSGGTSSAGGNSASGSGGEGNTGNATSDPPESDDGCSLKSGGTQRGASSLAALAALALGVWISRRRAR